MGQLSCFNKRDSFSGILFDRILFIFKILGKKRTKHEAKEEKAGNAILEHAVDNSNAFFGNWDTGTGGREDLSDSVSRRVSKRNFGRADL